MMIAFKLCNLVIPSEPTEFSLTTDVGKWKFEKAPQYADNIAVMQERHACGVTYHLEFPLPQDEHRLAIKDSAFNELLPISLAASFLTGNAVTVGPPMAHSEIKFLSVGEAFPRARGYMKPSSLAPTLEEFVRFVQVFANRFSELNQSEKLLLICHHFVDTASCWSMEDMFLGASILLEVVGATAETTHYSAAMQHAVADNPKAKKPAFMHLLRAAADHVGIPHLIHDCIKLRNSLIHEGSLSDGGANSKDSVSVLVADSMNWIDAYLYALLGLGQVAHKRWDWKELSSQLNSFSLLEVSPP
jgi:hypothetical protein